MGNSSISRGARTLVVRTGEVGVLRRVTGEGGRGRLASVGVLLLARNVSEIARVASTRVGTTVTMIKLST